MSFKRTTITTAEACEAGFGFEPRYPTGEPIGATFRVRGPQSPALLRHQQGRLELLRQREMAAKRQRKETEPLTLDELQTALVDLAVVYTLGWDGVEDSDGTPVAFSAAAARALYQEHPWLRDQVIAEGSELGNFIKPALKSSSSTPAPSSLST
jgi:tRNA splicing endonuclease